MVDQTLLQVFSKALGPSRIITDATTLALLAQDAMPPARLPAGTDVVQPLCVIQPESTADVATVVRLANTHRIPVIPIGGGSGLMGGAASVVSGVVLDLRQLQDIHIRAEDRMADVGSGVTIKALNQAATPHGLMCAHDPWTVAVATVGGTISTNSLGYIGGKYGAMGEQVLGVEVVLPTGDILTTRAVEKASTGPALHRLFIGAEGCFGIITRATVRLFPVPQARLLDAWEFRDFATGFTAINALLNAGLRPGLLEYEDEEPTPEYHPPATLYVSYEGPHRVAQAEAAEAADIFRQYGRPLAQRQVQTFWTQRHDRGDAYAAARAAAVPWHRRHPPIDYLHVALPPTAVLEYRRQSLALLAQHGLRTHHTGLWGYAGLFSMVYSGADVRTLAQVQDGLLRRCQDMQGAMEYCHGVGVRLAPLMAREHGLGMDILRQLKQGLDPHGVLNPGKLALTSTAGMRQPAECGS